MSSGRPKSFDPDTVVGRAVECFWSNGFEATSMQDLLISTGLSRSSLYESFGSKRGLFEACLLRYREERVRLMSDGLASADCGVAFISDMLHSVAVEARSAAPRGCLVMNTASELAHRDAEISQLVLECIAAFTEVFRRAVLQGQAEGDIPRSRSAKQLARFIVISMSGLRTLAKAGTPTRTLRNMADMVVEAVVSAAAR